MPYTLRAFEPNCKFLDNVSFEVLETVLPPTQIENVLAQHQAFQIRTRKLNMACIIFVLIAANLYTDRSFAHVLQKLVHGSRLFGPEPDYALPGDNAICYRRYQLGPRPLVSLFHLICQPMATADTPNAFLFGKRLMALDGTTEDVPDSEANTAAFGKHHAARGEAAFPQVKGVYLLECGTHAIVDAGFWPCHTSERVGGFRMLRSLTPEMLVMWDRGFHDYEMYRAVLARGADVLARMPANVHTSVIERLADGSYLTTLYPSDKKRRDSGESIVVRIVEYTLNEPALEGYGQLHRVATTLLDCRQAPALQVAQAYHQRWEIEMVIDEVDTHQRLASRPLRSQKPEGVIQELYALLLAHYLIRYMMWEAAQKAEIAPTQLSFSHAVCIIKEALNDFQIVALEQHPQLYERMLREIVAVRLPARRPRSNPRVVKCKMSKFGRKRQEHSGLPPLKEPFENAIVLI